jgi:hypothetical protein
MPPLLSRIRAGNGSPLFPAAELCQVPSLSPDNVQLELPKRAPLHAREAIRGYASYRSNNCDKETSRRRGLCDFIGWRGRRQARRASPNTRPRSRCYAAPASTLELLLITLTIHHTTTSRFRQSVSLVRRQITNRPWKSGARWSSNFRATEDRIRKLEATAGQYQDGADWAEVASDLD